MTIIKDILELWPLLGAIATILAGAGLWWLTKRFMPRETCTSCRETISLRIDGVETRINGVEANAATVRDMVSRMPTSQDLNDLRLTIERLNGDYRVMQATMDGQGAILKRMEYQLNRVDNFLKGGNE